MCWRDVSAYGNPLFGLLSLLKVTHYCLAQLVQMTIGVVTDLWYEMWFRDTACKFLCGKSQYFSSYLIIERSEAFNPVTLRGEPGTTGLLWVLSPPSSSTSMTPLTKNMSIYEWHEKIPCCKVPEAGQHQSYTLGYLIRTVPCLFFHCSIFPGTLLLDTTTFIRIFHKNKQNIVIL